MEKSEMQQDNSVLVNGASGGIGSMVVQIARAVVKNNGRVVAICSGANAEMVRELGADEVRSAASFLSGTDSEAYDTFDRSSTTKLMLQSPSTSPLITQTNASTQPSTPTESKGYIATVVITSNLESLL
jgi:D-arabinose 1-dehydrogenase-like Zn-dependent alcohol dehydrogenase